MLQHNHIIKLKLGKKISSQFHFSLNKTNMLFIMSVVSVVIWIINLNAGCVKWEHFWKFVIVSWLK
jgi:hypothetical protein